MDINELHKKFSLYGRNAKEWTRKCILLLPEIEKNRVWEKKHFNSIYEYAAKLAGMNRNTVNEALRVLEKTADKPELQQIIEQKGINAVRPVVTIATPETAKFWAEKAQTMSINTLETYVQEYKADLHMKAENGNYSHPQAILNLEVTMNLTPETLAKLQKLKGEKSWEELMQMFLQLQEEKVEQLKTSAIEKKTTSRAIPSAIEKYVKTKNNGTCAYPGCHKEGTILHHTKRFALNHTHNPEQIHLLCKSHEHLAHSGYIENEEKEPSQWYIKNEAYHSQPEQLNLKYEVDEQVIPYYSGSIYK